MPANISGYLFLLVTLALTVYSQGMVKWRALIHAPVTAEKGRIAYLFAMLTDPWIVSSLAASVLALLAWMTAVQHIELNRAYTFMALLFVFVPALAVIAFGERMSILQVLGVGLIVLGVAVVQIG
ncbi:MAG: EamA family transporter [Rhizobiales bacterium]|nr:EamA family transporter [Hyphomicrobiales bacterium]